MLHSTLEYTLPSSREAVTERERQSDKKDREIERFFVKKHDQDLNRVLTHTYIILITRLNQLSLDFIEKKRQRQRQRDIERERVRETEINRDTEP